MVLDAALPDAAFLTRDMASPLLPDRQPPRKPRLYPPPACRIVGITLRQRPDRVEMVGKNNPDVDPEGPFAHRRADRVTQGSDLLNQGALAPVGQGGREEDRCAGLAEAKVAGHPQKAIAQPFPNS